MAQCIICHPTGKKVTEGYVCTQHRDRRLQEGFYRVNRNVLEGPFMMDEGKAEDAEVLRQARMANAAGDTSWDPEQQPAALAPTATGAAAGSGQSPFATGVRGQAPSVQDLAASEKDQLPQDAAAAGMRPPPLPDMPGEDPEPVPQPKAAAAPKKKSKKAAPAAAPEAPPVGAAPAEEPAAPKKKSGGRKKKGPLASTPAAGWAPPGTGIDPSAGVAGEGGDYSGLLQQLTQAQQALQSGDMSTATKKIDRLYRAMHKGGGKPGRGAGSGFAGALGNFVGGIGNQMVNRGFGLGHGYRGRY